MQLHVLKQKLKKKHHLKGTYESNQTNIKIQKINSYIFSNFDVCSIAFEMYLLGGVLFLIFVLILLLLHFTPTVVASLKIRKRLILKKLLPLPAPFQHFRFQVCFRFQPLSSKCFRFPKKVTASSFRFRFHVPVYNNELCKRIGCVSLLSMMQQMVWIIEVSVPLWKFYSSVGVAREGGPGPGLLHLNCCQW